jgi:hypothetical protein
MENSMPQARNGRDHVFVSYSHADEDYLKRLRVHLGLLERRNIKIWTDKDIEPGMKWQDEIRDALSRTKVAVLMISTDFLSSDFITNQELPSLLAAAQSEGVAILPVIVKPSAFGDLEIEPLSCYQAVNMGRPLVKLKDDAEREEEFVRILQVIRQHMEGAPRPRSDAPRAAPVAAGPPSDFDAAESMEAEQTDGDNEESLPLVDALAADIEAMLADPRAQALSIQAVTAEEAAELMLVTEGRDGALLLELLDNDELPPAFQLEGEVRRHLVEQLGFNPPEIRGDRFWSILATADETIDVVGIAEIIGGLLDGVFSLPNADFDVAWQVLEQ